MRHQKINWTTLVFVVSYHLLLVGMAPFAFGVLSWSAWTGFLITFVVGGLTITAGYHRLYAHKAYEARPVFEWAVLLGSTLAFQWSALVWSHDHRLHHNHVDTDKDPYSVKKGFWHAHMLWLFTYRRKFDRALVADLLRNPRVVFQDRYYLALTIGVNAAVLGLACLFMPPLAAFWAVILLRIFAVHHCTWFINSLAHVWGSRTYARELSAVDNAVLAFLTFGEGYHNYHHAFASDYRNGVRWYHFDPTKWLVRAASLVGLTSHLRVIQTVRVQKALVSKDKRLLLDRLSAEVDELAMELSRKLEHLADTFDGNVAALSGSLAEFREASKEKRALLRIEIRRLRREIRANWKAWVALTRWTARRYAPTHSH
ncbi:MAG: fatty acid desaturase [Opitutales bacterium]|nr:fatty acid desaturase [Opitutales bacterium]